MLWKSSKHKYWQSIWRTCGAASYNHLLLPGSALQSHTHLSKISVTGFLSLYLMCCLIIQAWFSFPTKRPFFLSKIGSGLRRSAGQPGYILADLALCGTGPLSAWKKGSAAIFLFVLHLFFCGYGIWLFCRVPTCFPLPGGLFDGLPHSHAGSQRVFFSLPAPFYCLWRDFWNADPHGISC